MQHTFAVMRWEWAQWFEKRWWKGYLKKRPVDDYLNWKTKYWRDFLEQIELTVPNNAKVLDVGCGPAGIFTILNESKTVACDPLLPYYEDHIAHFSRSLYPNTEFIALPLEASTWKNQFDFVFCINVINQVKNFEIALQRLIDAAKPEGTVIISIDCHDFSFAKWLFRTLPVDILHPQQYNHSEYLSEFESRGLIIERKALIKTGFFFDYYAVVCNKK